MINLNTNSVTTLGLWFDTEFYFYGTLQDIGGKSKSSIDIDTEEFGSLIIQTDEDVLTAQKNNLLYRKIMVRVSGKQEYKTQATDKKSLKLIDFVEYDPQFDAEALKNILQKRVSSGRVLTQKNGYFWIIELNSAVATCDCRIFSSIIQFL